MPAAQPAQQNDPAQLDINDFLQGMLPAAEPAPDPRFQMGDEPLPLPPEFQPPAASLPTATEKLQSVRPLGESSVVETLRLPAAPEPGEVRYEQRHSVVTAYRFDGQVRLAPPWVDRNWAAYAPPSDSHPQGGPCLKVPTSAGGVAIVRVGDYCVVQDTIVDDPAAPGGRRVIPSQLTTMTAREFEGLYRAYVPEKK